MFTRFSRVLEKQRLKREMVHKYFLRQYMLNLPEGELDRLTDLPEPARTQESNRHGAIADAMIQKLGWKNIERQADEYYAILQSRGELVRGIPAFEDYFRYIDFVNQT